jgi:hypothetical protein
MADPINEETEGERPKKVLLTKRQIAARKRRIRAILREADALPIVDDRSADEIIGYNEHGHFD